EQVSHVIVTSQYRYSGRSEVARTCKASEAARGMHRTTYAGRSKRRLASPTAAVGPGKTLSRQNFKRKGLSNKLRLVGKEQKQGEAPTLIRMGEKSGSLTPFGSLGGASHGVGSDDNTHRTTAYRRSNSIKLAWRRICNLFLAVWQQAAFRTH